MKEKNNSEATAGKSVLFWGIIFAGLVLFNLVLFRFYFTNDPQTMRLLRFYIDYFHWPTWYSVNLWLMVVGIGAVLLLKTEWAQKGVKTLYASSFWRSGVEELRTGRWNQAFARLMIRRKITKRMLRVWIRFWQRLCVDRYDRYAARLTVLVFLLITLCYSQWLAPIRLFFLYRTNRVRYYIQWGYEHFYLTPLTSYMASGTVTWRLFIAPVTGVLLILWLLVFVRKLKKRRARHDR